MANRSNAKGVAWVALVLALVALVLAWVAFNRTGQDVEALVEQEVQEAIEEINQTAQDAVDENATGTENVEEDDQATTGEEGTN